MDSARVVHILTYFCLLLTFASSKSIFSESSILGERRHEVETAFPDLSLNKGVQKSSYSLHETDDFATICWNEVTTLHFFANGTSYGYVEYSISLEITAEEPISENHEVIEKYEIVDKSDKRKVLDFITVEKNNEEIRKVNRTVTCKSGNAYSNMFELLEKRAKVEIKLRSVKEELDMASVKSLSGEAIEGESEEVHGETYDASNSETDNESDNQSEITIGARLFTEDFAESKQDAPTSPSIEELATEPATQVGIELSTRKVAADLVRQLSIPNAPKNSQVEDTSHETVTNAQEQSDEEESGTLETSIDQTEAEPEDLTKENFPEEETGEQLIATRQFSSSIGPVLDGISPVPESLHSHNPCKKKVVVKLNLGIEDDTGKIDNIQKEIELDLNRPNDYFHNGELEHELDALIRTHYADTLDNSRLCDDDSSTPQLRSFEGPYDVYQDTLYTPNANPNPNPYYYPGNTGYQTFYVSPDTDYYLAPRIGGDTQPSWFENLKTRINHGVEQFRSTVKDFAKKK